MVQSRKSNAQSYSGQALDFGRWTLDYQDARFNR